MKTVPFSVFYFVAVIIIAHFFVPTEYHWSQHTISDLAAQGLKYQWIMQAGFIGFGLLLNIGLISKFIATKRLFYPDVLIMLYGLAVLLSGFFSAAPFLEEVAYSVQEDNLHSLFAQAAGVFFSVGILAYLLFTSDPQEKLIHTIFLILVIGTSIIFGLEENGIIHLGRGLIQRILYLVSFIWLLLSQYRHFDTPF
ncbi:MAG: DUF998 domain-containing protein [Chloroflexi bacterium]|nr:DUF998 domain-containing protein [Chloroflexota bacterium]